MSEDEGLHLILLRKDHSNCNYITQFTSAVGRIEDLLAVASARIHEELDLDPSLNVKLRVYRVRNQLLPIFLFL